MRSILVTGSDTGVGKTWVVSEIVRALVARRDRVQVVKVVETGVQPGQPGDALWAVGAAGAAERGRGAEAITLFTYSAALAPVSAATAEGRTVDWSAVVGAAKAIARPENAWIVFEGAGGIASPIDGQGHDWVDFAAELAVDQMVIVVPERLGAINQSRLCVAHARRAGLSPTIWLNRMEVVPPEVSASIRELLAALKIPLCDAESFSSPGPPAAAAKALVLPTAPTSSALRDRLADWLADRDRIQQRRRVRVTAPRSDGVLNLCDNDYLDLAHDPAVLAASIAAAERYGTSASASPLISGWKEPHEALVNALCAWHGFACGMLWTSGYAANSAVLGTLPEKGDLILADRLIHHSMIAGLSRSGARFMRYPHLDLDRLESELGGARPPGALGRARVLGPNAVGPSAPRVPTRWADRAPPTFVVTESVFSMDGDYPDLARLAALKREHGFILILDEAHALGWYGPAGAGLAAAAGIVDQVDVFVGTLGKTLASGGAYTLFHDELIRDSLINRAGEFIYSTGIPPGAAAAASAAIQRIRHLSDGQAQWQDASRQFRSMLAAAGWATLAGESPIVPVMLAAEADALALAAALRADGIWAAAVRPPTVPAGTSRLRFSLKRGFDSAAADRVLAAMERWRRQR